MFLRQHKLSTDSVWSITTLMGKNNEECCRSNLTNEESELDLLTNSMCTLFVLLISESFSDLSSLPRYEWFRTFYDIVRPPLFIYQASVEISSCICSHPFVDSPQSHLWNNGNIKSLTCPCAESLMRKSLPIVLDFLSVTHWKNIVI